MLQKNVEDKMEGQNNQCRSITENAHTLTFHEQYEKEETGICRTCDEGVLVEKRICIFWKVKCMERNQGVGREGYGWMILQNGRVSKHMVRQKG